MGVCEPCNKIRSKSFITIVQVAVRLASYGPDIAITMA